MSDLLLNPLPSMCIVCVGFLCISHCICVCMYMNWSSVCVFVLPFFFSFNFNIILLAITLILNDGIGVFFIVMGEF